MMILNHSILQCLVYLSYHGYIEYIHNELLSKLNGELKSFLLGDYICLVY